MGDLKLVDYYKVISKKNNTAYIVIVLYSLKSRCAIKMLKPYSEDLYSALSPYINSDISSFVFTNVMPDGSLRLDIEF